LGSNKQQVNLACSGKGGTTVK
jgi:hypothetical protein